MITLDIWQLWLIIYFATVFGGCVGYFLSALMGGRK